MTQNTTDPRASNLKNASSAAKKLKSMFQNNSERKAEDPQISITFGIEDNGQFFLECSNQNPHQDEAIEDFQRFEQLLKNLFPNEEISLNHIPITKILDLSDEAVSQAKNSLAIARQKI